MSLVCHFEKSFLECAADTFGCHKKSLWNLKRGKCYISCTLLPLKPWREGENLVSIIGMPTHKKKRRIVPRTDDFFDRHLLVKEVV